MKTLDFKTIKIGDRIKFTTYEFDIYTKREGVVIKIEDDHAIIYADGVAFWFNSDTPYQFKIIETAGDTLNFSGLDMSSMDFRQLPKNCLRNANFKNTDLTYAIFAGMDLHGANFAKADTYNTDFRQCNLRKADFRKCDLRYTILYECDLRDADLRGCDISAAFLHGAKLSNTVLDPVNRTFIENLTCTLHINF